jgi:hypothetical protein
MLSASAPIALRTQITPTVSSSRRDGLPEQGLSKNPAPQTVDEPAIEKSGYFSNLDKSNIRREHGR